MIPKIYHPNTVSKTEPNYKRAILFENSRGELVVKVKFPWEGNNLNEIKSIPGRVWNSDERYWHLPLNIESLYTLKKFKYVFNAALKKWGNDAFTVINNIEIKGLKGTLKPYQKEGVRLIEKFNGNALLADDMGLGKTIQGLAWLQLHPELRPAIVLCPAFLKINWEREMNKWMPDPNVQVIFGTDTSVPLTGDIIIINYHILANTFVETERIHKKTGKPTLEELKYTGWVDYLIDKKFKILLADEAHYLKNDTAKWTKATFKLARNIPHRIPMTGTPIESKPLEIFNAVKLANPTIFTNKWSFSHEFCGAKHNGFGWTFNGATNMVKLNEILVSRVMIRRLKKDVLKDLPDKIYSFVPLEINNRKQYESAEKDFKNYVRNGVEIEARKLMALILKNDLETPVEINDFKLERLKDEKAGKASPLVQIGVLKQLAAKGKLKSSIDWIANFLDSGEKLVIFCEYRFIVDSIYNHFKKIAVKIDGSVSLKARDKVVQEFQTNNKIRLFIGNKAAQEGLTLTAASNVAIIEYPWNPGQLTQRIDRCHRIGQKYTVNVYYLMAMDTIEEKIAIRLDEKQKTITSILDGEEIDNEDLLTHLINSYK